MKNDNDNRKGPFMNEPYLEMYFHKSAEYNRQEIRSEHAIYGKIINCSVQKKQANEDDENDKGDNDEKEVKKKMKKNAEQSRGEEEEENKKKKKRAIATTPITVPILAKIRQEKNKSKEMTLIGPINYQVQYNCLSDFQTLEHNDKRTTFAPSESHSKTLHRHNNMLWSIYDDENASAHPNAIRLSIPKPCHYNSRDRHHSALIYHRANQCDLSSLVLLCCFWNFLQKFSFFFFFLKHNANKKKIIIINKWTNAKPVIGSQRQRKKPFVEVYDNQYTLLCDFPFRTLHHVADVPFPCTPDKIPAEPLSSEHKLLWQDMQNYLQQKKQQQNDNLQVDITVNANNNDNNNNNNNNNNMI
ncbi:leucine-rich repeat-containing protein [Reticulomyxa filosa]|uniref:Leucine-rich repeat-containing protein n=1 Tax=Reticulomyxa filosa TaxID=46433 RepID=X6MCU0_RETFI|nr:leucine-rich repeat-containing protein [Reticulomyxa filosa]|eukprot:ETO11267.1 leucine-rich repeat-containing protein [Reticulomyxa filosa]